MPDTPTTPARERVDAEFLEFEVANVSAAWGQAAHAVCCGWALRVRLLAAERDAAEACADRLTRVTQNCYMLLPILPGEVLTFADGNLEPHVRALVDEFAIRTEQLRIERSRAEKAERERDALRAALVPLVEHGGSLGDGPDNDRFYCEHCEMSHTHYTQIPHTEWCRWRKAEQALAAARGEAKETT